MTRKMKDSGIEWIGEIPEEWEIRRLRFLCSITTGNKDTINANAGGEYPFYVRSPKVERIDTYSFDGESVLTAGDGVGAGKVFHYVNGKFDYHQRVYNLHYFKDVLGKYLYYYLKENFIKEIEKSNAKSTVDSIRLPMLLNFPIALPRENEQESIIIYLDSKCTKIDETIEKQKQVIEKLKAYKQSIITEAVTKGVNPDVPMKYSGIEWIGEIPEHWEVMKLKYDIRTIESGTSVNAAYYPASESEIGVLKTSCVYNNEFKPNENKCVESYDLDRVTCSLRNDTIVVSRMNTPELVGSCGYVSQSYSNIYLPDRLWQIDFSNKINPEFSWCFLSSSGVKWLISVIATGTSSSMKNISQEQLKNIVIALPTYEEQENIAQYLDEKKVRIDEAIKKKETLIQKLTDYKKSLIYECVTGKREV